MSARYELVEIERLYKRLKELLDKQKVLEKAPKSLERIARYDRNAGEINGILYVLEGHTIILKNKD